MKACLTLASVFMSVFVGLSDTPPDGGEVKAPITGKVVVLLNQQKRLPSGKIKTFLNTMESYLSLPMVFTATQDEAKTAGALIVLEEKAGDSTLMVEPEQSRARINVMALASDSPSDDVLTKRVAKEMWRALAYCCGGTDSDFQPCLMRSIMSLKSLDDEPKLLIPSPLVMNKIMSGAEARGVNMIREVSYRTACEEGWAPAPTNDVQRSIVQEVKASRAAKKK